MRKKYIIGILITIFLGVIVAMILLICNRYNVFNLNKKQDIKLSEENLQNEKDIYNAQIVSTSSSNEKTSPMALLIFKTNYKECNHIIINRKDIPHYLVNKTKSELENEYQDWVIEKFSSNEIVFYKEVDGICNEHYVLRDSNGYIAIYTVDSSENETLKEITQIVTSYLPETDSVKLIEGIRVIGKDDLNAALEDYE